MVTVSCFFKNFEILYCNFLDRRYYVLQIFYTDRKRGARWTCLWYLKSIRSPAPFAKRPFGLLRSVATIFAHKKALPSSLCIQVIPHASMNITWIHVMSELYQNICLTVWSPQKDKCSLYKEKSLHLTKTCDMLFYELVTDGFTLESLRRSEAPKVSRL